MTNARVVLVDDHDLFRSGLSSLIDSQSDIDVVGEASDGLEGVGLALRLQPDLIVMDVSMPSCDGIEATRRIRAKFDRARILMLSVNEDADTFLAAMQAGAVGYMQKYTESKTFLHNLRRALAGETVLSPALVGILTTEYRRLVDLVSQQPAVPVSEGAGLTARELEILRLIVDDMGNREIAAQLSISQHTVKSHVRNILSKLHAANRRDAKRVALQTGLIESNR